MSIYSRLVAALAVVAACSSSQAPPVQVSTQNATLNTRWHANLASPASLAGAVQMNGSASMAPASNGTTTEITIDLANAAPGGIHPWEVHAGRCDPGIDYGVFGSSSSYPPLEVNSDGKASATASVSMMTPKTGNYFVLVRASAGNPETIVACGNLAPPTQ